MAENSFSLSPSHSASGCNGEKRLLGFKFSHGEGAFWLTKGLKHEKKPSKLNKSCPLPVWGTIGSFPASVQRRDPLRLRGFWPGSLFVQLPFAWHQVPRLLLLPVRCHLVALRRAWLSWHLHSGSSFQLSLRVPSRPARPPLGKWRGGEFDFGFEFPSPGQTHVTHFLNGDGLCGLDFCYQM